MSGTEWTDPGQGATAEALYLTVCEMFPASARTGAPTGTLNRLYELRHSTHKTNLRLTGSQLTADDLKRIEQCEVMR